MNGHRAGRALIVVAVLAVPLAVASLAFACARLATLKLDRSGARPGATVGAVGVNYNSDARSSAVALRFNSRNGRVLWEGRANSRGSIKATFEAPDVRRGDYVIVATQQTAEGRPAAGTPGRAPLEIRRAGRRRAKSDAPAAAPVAPGTGGGSGGGLPAAAVATPALLLLLAAGTGAFVLTTRRRAGGAGARASS